MNDLKTAERSSMKQATLKHLMLWHSLAKDLSCEQLPVMAFLKEFRMLSGQHGLSLASRLVQPVMTLAEQQTVGVLRVSLASAR